MGHQAAPGNFLVHTLTVVFLPSRARLRPLCRRPPRCPQRRRTAQALGARHPLPALPLPPPAPGATEATPAMASVQTAAAATGGEEVGATATVWRRSRPSSTRSCGTLASRDELTTPSHLARDLWGRGCPAKYPGGLVLWFCRVLRSYST